MMKKIMLFEPGISTDNLGDQIIVQGVKEAFRQILEQSFVIEFSTHLPLYNRHVQHCEKADLKLICGSNLLVGNFGSVFRFRQWPVDILTAKSLFPCILIGVGAQKYGQKIGPYSKMIYRKILDPSVFHSVRDSYTARQLQNAGIDNVLNTGCPSLWKMTPEKCAGIPVEKGREAIFTLTDYRKNPVRDQAMITELCRKYETVFFWPQGSGDFSYFLSMEGTEKVQIIPPSLKEYDAFLTAHEDLDYIGTRLHGGIRALQHNRRSLIIGIDNRALEMQKDYGLPVIRQENIEELGQWINRKRKTQISIPEKAVELFLSQFHISYPSFCVCQDR